MLKYFPARHPFWTILHTVIAIAAFGVFNAWFASDPDITEVKSTMSGAVVMAFGSWLGRRMFG